MAAIRNTFNVDLQFLGNIRFGLASNSLTQGRVRVAPDVSGGVALSTFDVVNHTAALFKRQVSGSVNTLGSIYVTDIGTSYNTSSDYRLKNVDGPITGSGEYIDALKPCQGTWKANGAPFIGLIAHEAQEASLTDVATGEKDGAEMQSLNYSAPEMMANIVAELQSLRARVAAGGL